MVIKTADSTNTLNLVMDVEPSVSATPQVGSVQTSQSNVLIPLAEAVAPVQYVSTAKVKTASKAIKDEKILVFDCETTGTNPWDYKFLVVSFWDLSKPVSTIITFSGWDEEKLTKEVAAYLNEEKPDAMVDYNDGYDQRCLLTRFMLYQVPVPGWNNIKFYDPMNILKKGTTQNIYSSQGAGTEEQWLQFFFGESKPYDIAECFEGVRNHDLTRMIIRNRTCVEGVGHIYLLFREVTDEEPTLPGELKPTVANIDEYSDEGQCLIKCEVCNAVNQFDCSSEPGQCWRCSANLPQPTTKNILKETVRKVDYSKVGISEKKSTTKKTTTTTA
jgi:hypothetical protein